MTSLEQKMSEVIQGINRARMVNGVVLVVMLFSLPFATTAFPVLFIAWLITRANVKSWVAERDNLVATASVRNVSE